MSSTAKLSLRWPSSVSRSWFIESAPIFKVLEQFKKAPVRMVTIVDEYGVLQGIVTQTDLLEAIASELPDVEGEEGEYFE